MEAQVGIEPTEVDFKSLHFSLYFNRLALEAFCKLLIFKVIKAMSCAPRIGGCGTISAQKSGLVSLGDPEVNRVLHKLGFVRAHWCVQENANPISGGVKGGNKNAGFGAGVRRISIAAR